MCICRVDQCRLYTLYMTVFLMISLPEIAYIHRIYIYIYGSGQPYIYGVYLYKIFCRNFIKYTGIYGAYVQLWPTHGAHVKGM